MQVRTATRFYLEIRSPTEQLQLQALSLTAMNEWADAINAAVAAAFGSAPMTAGANSPGRLAALDRLLASGLKCADCNAAAPEWASLNLCVPLCLECAGCHRSMGTHVSKVRAGVTRTLLPLAHAAHRLSLHSFHRTLIGRTPHASGHGHERACIPRAGTLSRPRLVGACPRLPLRRHSASHAAAPPR
jgi:hypothetical protein